MEITEEHKDLLKQLGLTDEDFERFDGNQVRYEYDATRGVRIYDPFYQTSYNEYIGIDGWSAWSSEHDTFMSDVLEVSRKSLGSRETPQGASRQKEIEEALKKKFSPPSKTESD